MSTKPSNTQQPTASEEIFHYVESHENPFLNLSLLAGDYGQILYYGYLYKSYRNPQYLERVYDLTEAALETFQEQISGNENLDATHGSGFSGFFWVLGHLSEIGVLEESLDDIIDPDIQEFVEKSLDADLEIENYDPLYGFIGKGLFLIQQKEKPFAKRGIEKIIRALDHSKITDKDGNYTWVDIRNITHVDKNKSEHVVYDCGLAHGVTGIIAFCCEAYPVLEDQELRTLTKILIRKASSWLLSQEKDNELFKFPIAKFKNAAGPGNHPYYARLGWCYGDICIAITLTKVGSILDEDDYFHNKAMEIALHSTSIDLQQSGTVKENGKIDPSFCHGTCGISYIYLKLFEQLKDERLKQASQFWEKITREQTAQYLEEQNLFSELSDEQEDQGLLYGYMGIGLVNLSLEENKSFTWDKMLLL